MRRQRAGQKSSKAREVVCTGCNRATRTTSSVQPFLCGLCDRKMFEFWLQRKQQEQEEKKANANIPKGQSKASTDLAAFLRENRERIRKEAAYTVQSALQR